MLLSLSFFCFLVVSLMLLKLISLAFLEIKIEEPKLLAIYTCISATF